jgi:hypothetical protein
MRSVSQNAMHADLRHRISSPAAAKFPGGVFFQSLAWLGRVWISTAQSRPGEYQHPPFSEEVRTYIGQIKVSLDEVFFQTLEAWEDGFRRDQHVEREIALWFHIAAVYKRCIADKETSFEQRKDYFNALLSCTFGPRERIFEIFQPKAISKKEAEDAIALFFADK